MFRPASRRPDRYTVYHCYDGAGEPLYTGVTGDLGTRLASHAGKIWFLDVRQIRLECYDNEAEARYAERDAIQVEQPRYNIIHKGAPLRLPDRIVHLHPSRLRTLQLIGAATPSGGATPGWLHAALEAEGLGIARGTLHRWLRDEVRAGRATQVRHGCYQKALEKTGTRRESDVTSEGDAGVSVPDDTGPA